MSAHAGEVTLKLSGEALRSLKIIRGDRRETVGETLGRTLTLVRELVLRTSGGRAVIVRKKR